MAALMWLVWLPRYRPPLREGERYGIDVSHHQGVIDWNGVARDGIRFAYMKATEGGDFTDDRFASNWEAAGEAGIDRGAYHFFTLCRPGDVQADHFMDVVPDDDTALPPAVDLELKGNCGVRPSNDAVQREIRAFLEIVEERTGHPVLLYVGDEFDSRYPVRGSLRRPLWTARFLLRPSDDDWIVWQVMPFAHVAGIDGDVDLDVMRNVVSGCAGSVRGCFPHCP